METLQKGNKTEIRTVPRLFFSSCWRKFFCFIFGHVYKDVKCPRCLFVPALGAYDNPVEIKERTIIHQECSPAICGGIEDYKEFIDEVRKDTVEELEKLTFEEDGRHGLTIVVKHTVNSTNPKLVKK